MQYNFFYWGFEEQKNRKCRYNGNGIESVLELYLIVRSID